MITVVLNLTSAKMSNTGICYGVSVGPGDPELITKKAYGIIESSDVIFLPSSPKENCRVYQIIKGAFDDIDEDKFICIDTAPMADPKNQSERYDILAAEVSKLLDAGKKVSFPALGEVSIYSTYAYVHERLISKGYESKLISGISSIQEIADRLSMPLVMGDEQLHVFPDSDNINEKLKLSGTKIFMKPKGDLQDMVSIIKEHVSKTQESIAAGISNCGTAKEIVASRTEELCKLSGYMTVIIVKSKMY